MKNKDRPIDASQSSSMYDNEEVSETDFQQNDPDNEALEQARPNYTAVVKGLFSQ